MQMYKTPKSLNTSIATKDCANKKPVIPQNLN